MNYIRLLIVTFCLLITVQTNAQQIAAETKMDSLLLPEVLPSFPGGAIEWRKFLQRNLHPEVPIDNGALAGLYTVQVKFIVHVDGSVSSIEPITKFGFGMEEEVIRVILKSGKWTPGLLQGKPIKAYMVQSVTFMINDE